MLTAVAFAAQASPARPAGKRSTPVCVWQVCVGPAAAIAAAPAPWPPRCDVDMYFIREKMREMRAAPVSQCAHNAIDADHACNGYTAVINAPVSTYYAPL